MKKVAGTLKLIYSQYRELASFAQFGSDLDEDTKARLDQGARIVEVLKQNRGTPIPVEKQVAIIFAVVRNHLKDVAVDQVAEYESELYDFLDSNEDAKALMTTIRETGAYDDEIEKKLDAALVEFTSRFVRQQ
jgi:F-type H+-transporting ATPase subunit alpha